MNRRALLAALATLIFCVSGCARLASTRAATWMIRAPKSVDPRITWTSLRPSSQRPDAFDQRFRVEVGPPRANLLVSTIEPGPGWTPPAGTILLLHGAYGRSEDMIPTARAFAANGYRAVLVDMRGHGRSTGERITYGVQESQDLSQVLSFLERNGLLTGRIGVYGFSFGAAAAIELAGRDPRVGAVVAVAPYSSLHEAARHLVRTRIPGANLFVTDQWIDETVEEAGRQGGFDSRAASPLAAIQRTEAKVLLIHGDADTFIEPRHSIMLDQATGGRSRIVLVPGADHASLQADETGTAARLALSWFNRWMPAAPGRRDVNGRSGCPSRFR
ncbi:MAG: alpha/beta fold hydrolase [Planctomycetota bacterium]